MKMVFGHSRRFISLPSALADGQNDEASHWL